MTIDTALPSLVGKKVLVTGGLGFIGSNIVSQAVELGAEVYIFDCLDPRSGGNMQNIAAFKSNVQVIINDIRNFEALCAAVVDKDIIFNCAAFTSHPNSMKEPLVDIDVNCKGVINLLEALRRFNREARLVHIGTSTQIGKMHDNSIDEYHCEYPVDIYSANKSASEKYVLVYAHAYKLGATVVRLANNFGPRSNIRSADFGFMNFFVGLGLKGKDITVFGDGKQLRTVSYIDDSVRALILAATQEATVGNVYFAVSDRQYSVMEIASGISTVIGGRVRQVDWPKDRAAIEVGDAVISNARITSAIPWTAEIGLLEGLKLTEDYFRPIVQHYLD